MCSGSAGLCGPVWTGGPASPDFVISPGYSFLTFQEVKYGVLSTQTLQRDLETWDTLYIAGRLHKPVLGLSCVETLRSSLGANVRAALTLALLQLPGTFTELQLYEKIAGISYSGDPRMSVPGAENPEKVQNIVRGPGVLDGFRRLYGPYFAPVGLRWQGDAMRGIREWRGAGEVILQVSVISAR